MNCRIMGSGNTPLHVAAINDQVECVRILLLRGCDTSIVNNSHQNAHQVAVIAGNLSLAELINSHRAEHVVPYRDKPRFNPARRPQGPRYPSTENGSGKENGSGQMHLTVGPRTNSPSLSQRTNNTTTTSSGVCCDEDKKRDGYGQEDEEEEDDEDEEETGENEEKNGENGSSSEDNSTVTAGMTVRAVSDYNSGDPSHLQLRRNDLILLLPSNGSPPTIASQRLLLGRRCIDGQEGYFPACCIERIKKNKSFSGEDGGDRVEGRRDMKYKNVQSATLPTRGRRGGRKCLLDKGVTRHYQERTVTLHRGSKGFGFVLRGAKDSSPILNKQLMQPGGSMPLIGLQYFDEIETGGVADAAGLKRGDFLLAVNDVDVRQMSHENVVQLIRKSGDKVTMTIATPAPKQLVSILKKKGKSNKTATAAAAGAGGDSNGFMANSTIETMSTSQSQNQMSQSVYSSFGGKPGSKAPPPAPPKRDPSTTLTASRARARSLVVPSEVRSAHHQTLMMVEMKGDFNANDKSENEPKSEGGRTSVNRSRSLKTESSLDSIKVGLVVFDFFSI